MSEWSIQAIHCQICSQDGAVQESAKSEEPVSLAKMSSASAFYLERQFTQRIAFAMNGIFIFKWKKYMWKYLLSQPIINTLNIRLLLIAISTTISSENHGEGKQQLLWTLYFHVFIIERERGKAMLIAIRAIARQRRWSTEAISRRFWSTFAPRVYNTAASSPNTSVTIGISKISEKSNAHVMHT